MGNLRHLRAFGTVLAVLACLAVIDLIVAGPFYAHVIAPEYVTPHLVLADRTAGQNLVIFTEALERMPRSTPQVALVGDSTMNAMAPAVSEIPYLLGVETRKTLRGETIRPVQAGIVGLCAGDAALLTSKLIGSGTAVIVYGITLRAFPAEQSRFATRLKSQLGPDDLWRLTAVGGLPWLHANAGADRLVAGLVESTWKTYAYRTNLRRWAWERGLQQFVPAGSWLAKVIEPPAATANPAVAPRTGRGEKFEWTRANYGEPNANWDAIELYGRLCQRYAPGRCVLYAGPVNPVGRAALAEPGLYDEYLARLRVLAGRYGLIWRDYTNALGPGEFRKPMFGGWRDPIHPNEQGRAKLARLLAEPVADAVRCAAHRGPCLGI